MFEGAIIRSLDRDELRRAHTAGVKGAIRECELAREERLCRRLREMKGCYSPSRTVTVSLSTDPGVWMLESQQPFRTR